MLRDGFGFSHLLAVESARKLQADDRQTMYGRSWARRETRLDGLSSIVRVCNVFKRCAWHCEHIGM